MSKKLKLADLYVVGQPLTITEGPDRSVTVWLQKLNTLEAEEAFRRGQAARSRVLTSLKDPTSDLYQAARMQVLDMGDDTELLIQYLLIPEEARIRSTREAEFAAREEWSEDNYLQGLRDSWVDELEKRWVEDPEDAEALRVLNEMKRFDEQVEAAVKTEIDQLRSEHDEQSLEELQDKIHESVLRSIGDRAWLDGYHIAEIRLGTRDINLKTKHYFESYQEVQELPSLVLALLMAGFEELRLDVAEGKELEEALDSSTQSEQSSDPVMAVSSGLQVVAP